MRSIACLLLLSVALRAQDSIPGKAAMTPEQATLFAKLALKGIAKEYPNKPADVLNNEADVKNPRVIHPAFYGCYDWHSSVHGHWMLVKLLKTFPDHPMQQDIRATLATNLTAANLKIEADYFSRPNAKSYERPYGWSWLLKLAEELYTWDDPQGKVWSKNLQPLTDVIVVRYIEYFPKQTYPIRSGVHSSTAFGLTFALDYAKMVGHQPLQKLIAESGSNGFCPTCPRGSLLAYSILLPFQIAPIHKLCIWTA